MTGTELAMPVVEPQPGNVWNDWQFIRGQGFEFTLQALHHPLFTELEGLTGFDPSRSATTVTYFGSHSAPTVTATQVPGTAADILVRWQQTSAVGTRGSSNTTWKVTAFPAGEPNSPLLVEHTEVQSEGETSYERRLTVNDTFSVWTVTVLGSNAAGRGPVGQTTVTVSDKHIDLAVAPATIAENATVPSLTVTATVKLADANGTLGNTGPLTVSVNVDSSSTATRGSGTAADYDVPDGTFPITLEIPANAEHGHRVTATLTGLTIVADNIDDPDETIVFSGTVTGTNSVISMNDATFTIAAPIPVPSNVRVVAVLTPSKSWQITWDGSPRNDPFFAYEIFMDRYVDGTIVNSARGSSSDHFKEVPVSPPDPNFIWLSNVLQATDGESIRIGVEGVYNNADGVRTNSPRSEYIFFGSHPAPEVTATPVPDSTNIRVRWRPTSTDRRGGSPVRWTITASAPGETDVQSEVPDTGPNESNPGEITLAVGDSSDAWTVKVQAHNAAGLGLEGEATVNLNGIVGLDVTGDGAFTELDGQAIHWVISTPSTYGSGPSPDCGNQCFPPAGETRRVAQVQRGLRDFLTNTDYADLKALVDRVYEARAAGDEFDVTGDGAFTELDGQAIHWVISTPSAYGSGPSTDCGRQCFPAVEETGRVTQVRRGLRDFVTNDDYANLKALVDRVFAFAASSQ